LFVYIIIHLCFQINFHFHHVFAIFFSFVKFYIYFILMSYSLSLLLLFLSIVGNNYLYIVSYHCSGVSWLVITRVRGNRCLLPNHLWCAINKPYHVTVTTPACLFPLSNILHVVQSHQQLEIWLPPSIATRTYGNNKVYWELQNVIIDVDEWVVWFEEWVVWFEEWNGFVPHHPITS
jgi:hypothetical protein